MSSATAARTLPSAWRQLGRDAARSRRALQLVRRRVIDTPEVDPVTSAEIAALRHVDDERLPGIRRKGRAAHFSYVDPHGRRVESSQTIARIKALAIPPAWTDVWICPDPNGHLQATGRDARGRKQYRYHPQWTAVRDEVKYGRLLAFAKALPRIRARTKHDLRRPGLPREKVLAAVVQLLEKTLIRVGNEEYARDNHSFGLTTLRTNHASVHGSTVHFEFRGKSGVAQAVDLHDARLARIIKACRDLPGHELFQYVNDERKRQAVGSADVNAYLRDITDQPFTSKDFRTWGGTVLAACELARASGGPATKRRINEAVKAVSKRLGNTPAVCRKNYIHPVVLAAAAKGTFVDRPDEKAVAALLRKHISKA
jgi:DNA topoisomerase-1